VKVGKVGEWPVKLLDPQGKVIDGRVVVAKLPAPDFSPSLANRGSSPG
jgi:hypothetical protein